MDDQAKTTVKDWEVRLQGEEPERLTVKGAELALGQDGNLTFARNGRMVTAVARGAWAYVGCRLAYGPPGTGIHQPGHPKKVPQAVECG
jgi:hypothetical protein